MRRNTLVQIGLLVAGVVLVGVVVATIWLGARGDIEGNTASLVIGGVSAFASASLAIATYTTVLQNRRTVEELQKDREKPLAEDELRQLVVPFEEQLANQISDMEEEGSTWVQIRNAYGHRIGTRFHRYLKLNDISDTVLRKTKKDNQSLHEQIESHNEATHGVRETVDSILQLLDEAVRDYAQENYARSDMLMSEDVRRVSRCIVQDFSGEPSGDIVQELWENHRTELSELLTDEERGRLNETKKNYLDECQSLRGNLLDHKVELQRRYGISVQDLS